MRYLLSICLVLICAGASASELLEDLRGCRAVTAELERLACYDQILIETGESTESEAVSGKAAAVVMEPESVAVASDFGFEFSVKDAAPSLVSSIIDVRKNAKGGLVVTLANEQVWQQSASERLFLDEGDSVTIYRGALSAFYLAVDGKGRRYRFARVE